MSEMNTWWQWRVSGFNPDRGVSRFSDKGIATTYAEAVEAAAESARIAEQLGFELASVNFRRNFRVGTRVDYSSAPPVVQELVRFG